VKIKFNCQLIVISRAIIKTTIAQILHNIIELFIQFYWNV